MVEQRVTELRRSECTLLRSSTRSLLRLYPSHCCSDVLSAISSSSTGANLALARLMLCPECRLRFNFLIVGVSINSLAFNRDVKVSTITSSRSIPARHTAPRPESEMSWQCDTFRRVMPSGAAACNTLSSARRLQELRSRVLDSTCLTTSCQYTHTLVCVVKRSSALKCENTISINSMGKCSMVVMAAATPMKCTAAASRRAACLWCPAPMTKPCGCGAPTLGPPCGCWWAVASSSVACGALTAAQSCPPELTRRFLSGAGKQSPHNQQNPARPSLFPSVMRLLLTRRPLRGKHCFRKVWSGKWKKYCTLQYLAKKQMTFSTLYHRTTMVTSSSEREKTNLRGTL
eukprot:m.280673 g.280673  ORF g.280673 m.280673 type:complete len:345 (-) comp22885_c4_seq14:829-1863(-)